MTKKRILLLYFGFVLTLLVGTWAILGKTGVSRTFVENLLAKVIRRDRFSLRDAAVDLGDAVEALGRIAQHSLHAFQQACWIQRQVLGFHGHL